MLILIKIGFLGKIIILLQYLFGANRNRNFLLLLLFKHFSSKWQSRVSLKQYVLNQALWKNLEKCNQTGIGQLPSSSSISSFSYIGDMIQSKPVLIKRVISHLSVCLLWKDQKQFPVNVSW